MPNDHSLEEQVARLVDRLSSSQPSTSVRDPFPSLPIMAGTRLQLDLLLNDSVIDLKGVAAVILSDAGATLQVLRLIGEEFPNEDDRPKRLEDCIVSLSLARCYQTVCAAPTPNNGPHVAEWQRCRRIAECARDLAADLDSISPDEAYLAGLLSRLGNVPHLLGWKDDDSLSSESKALGVMLAYHWNLPHYVLVAIQEQHKSDNSSKWRDILLQARQLVDQRASDEVAVRSDPTVAMCL